MKKITIYISLALICPMFSFAQEESVEHTNVLDSPENWGLEIIKFPLGFASEIDYSGFEEIRFAPKWSDVNSPDFWTYAFVWYLDSDASITTERLTKYMNMYYNGIMQIDSTKSIFIELNDGSFAGSIRTYDHFTTKKEIVLNARMKAEHITSDNKYTYLFHISLLLFDHEIWNELNRVKLLNH